jgi:hypothetical protein
MIFSIPLVRVNLFYCKRAYFLAAQKCNVNKADIVFLLDASGSVGAVNYERTKQFIVDVVTALDIGQAAVRVGLVRFESAVSEIVALKVKQLKFSWGPAWLRESVHPPVMGT